MLLLDPRIHRKLFVPTKDCAYFINYKYLWDEEKFSQVLKINISELLWQTKPVTTATVSWRLCMSYSKVYEGQLKKFIWWQKNSHGMWPNKVYFSTYTLSLQSSLFFNRCCSARIPLIKKVIDCRYVIIWTLQPMNFFVHPSIKHRLVSWDSRIRLLHLCRGGKTFPIELPFWRGVSSWRNG